MSGPAIVRHWIDERVDIRGMFAPLMEKTVPRHRYSHWYLLGGVTLFLFGVQVCTGLLLLLYYRPSTSEAYESVQYITNRVEFGWLVRSVHSWSANLMIFMAFAHIFSVAFLRAYRKPRELTWMSGMVLLLLCLGFGFSGYLLPYNASGQARLLRGADEISCIACHNGGSGVTPAAPNVFSEIAKGGHPFATGNNAPDRAEGAVLNNNRHATCVDCHNPHGSMQASVLGAPPLIRPSQTGALGISAADGVTALNPALNQYENCLRCHGSSSGKVANTAKYGYLPVRLVTSGDPLNVISEFSGAAASSHPVMHDRKSALAQPSLRSQMLNLDGTNSTRFVGMRILCTDCHNSDDNREFGGTGPNGPHGSRFSHILERRYEFSVAAVPGGLMSSLFPNPDLTVNGPYALCGKCHDLQQLLTNTTFTEHARHINDGFSCSACHTAHGMKTQTENATGERMVSFDLNVVAADGALPISYNRALNSCALTCHNHTHGTIAAATSLTVSKPK